MIPSLENEFQAPASAVENLKIPIVGSKMKVVESIWCDLSKLVQEGQKANENKFSRIWLTNLEKTPKNYIKMQLSQNMVFELDIMHDSDIDIDITMKIPSSGKAAFLGSFWAFSQDW